LSRPPSTYVAQALLGLRVSIVLSNLAWVRESLSPRGGELQVDVEKACGWEHESHFNGGKILRRKLR
jgi:hypothetical protein